MSSHLSGTGDERQTLLATMQAMQHFSATGSILLVTDNRGCFDHHHDCSQQRTCFVSKMMSLLVVLQSVICIGLCRWRDERDCRDDDRRDRRDRRSPPPAWHGRYPSDRDRMESSSQNRDQPRDWKRRRFDDAPVPTDRRAGERAARWQAEVHRRLSGYCQILY